MSWPTASRRACLGRLGSAAPSSAGEEFLLDVGFGFGTWADCLASPQMFLLLDAGRSQGRWPEGFLATQHGGSRELNLPAEKSPRQTVVVHASRIPGSSSVRCGRDVRCHESPPCRRRARLRLAAEADIATPLIRGMGTRPRRMNRRRANRDSLDLVAWRTA